MVKLVAIPFAFILVAFGAIWFPYTPPNYIGQPFGHFQKTHDGLWFGMAQGDWNWVAPTWIGRCAVRVTEGAGMVLSITVQDDTWGACRRWL